jgi:hypothetical protein
MINAEDFGEFFDVFGRRLCLAVENGGDGNLTPAKLIGNCFEVQPFVCFGLK